MNESIRFELTIPGRYDVVPIGWAEKYYLPQIEGIDDPDWLWSTPQAELQGRIAQHKQQGKDTQELQAAKMFNEIRIGELLGAPERGGDMSKSSMLDSVPDARERKARTDLSHALRRLAWYLGRSIKQLAHEAVRNGNRSRGAVTRYIEENVDREPTNNALDIRQGDFFEVLQDIPDHSVALILTDPPYPAEFLPEWSKLGEFASRKLADGGSLLVYSGQGNLPECLRRLSEHLRYWWVLSLLHSHGSQNLPGKFVTIGWKPILWFVNERRRDNQYVADRLTGSSPRKTMHEWGQGRDELKPLIETLTAPGDLIVDPFAGSGTVGEAALALGRQFIGAEIDESV